MWARQRRPDFPRLDLADPAELLHQQILLGDDLPGFVQVLQATTAADTKVGAICLDPLRGRCDDSVDPGFGIITVDVGIDELDLLTRQGTIDKHRFAIHMGDPPQVVGKRFDLSEDRGLGQGFTVWAFGHTVF